MAGFPIVGAERTNMLAAPGKIKFAASPVQILLTARTENYWIFYTLAFRATLKRFLPP